VQNGGKKEWDLARLLHAIAEIPEIERISYTTSHPTEVDDSLVKAHSEIAKLIPFLHLPVQSGSDAILQKMNRRHTVAQYLQTIENFRKHTPQIAFSSDFIVGFPGETVEDFEQTLELVRKVNYSQAFSFKYSKRPGTVADKMSDQILESVKVERLERLQNLLKEQQINFNNNCIGGIMSVLFQKPGKHDRQVIGKSQYMQSVVVSDVEAEDFLHSNHKVTIEKATLSCLEGKLAA
jgi:tRNA-2-methylthio-N6-dimethylallyladenosine synthase